jgi:hypothetical protein
VVDDDGMATDLVIDLAIYHQLEAGTFFIRLMKYCPFFLKKDLVKSGITY